MGTENPSNQDQNLKSTESLTLPANLEAQSIARFDQLVAKGELIYEDSTAETVENQGFKVSHR